MKNYFSTNLKLLLSMKGFSQTELANRLGIKPQNISKYLTGDNFPSIEILIAMSEVFGVTIDDLLKVDMRDISKSLTVSSDYEKVENVDKLIKVFEGFTEELRKVKSNS